MNDLLTFEVLKWIVITIMGIAVWFFKSTLTDLKQDVEMIKREYLSKEDFKEFKVELRAMFDNLRTDIRAMSSHNEKS